MLSDIKSCTAEEADPRIIRHAINQVKNGINCITIETVDSDVLVLSISNIQKILEAGAFSVFVRLLHKEYDIIEIYKKLGPDLCNALAFFHSFTGCDTSSSFFGKGKTTLFDAWLSFPQITKLKHSLQ